MARRVTCPPSRYIIKRSNKGVTLSLEKMQFSRKVNLQCMFAGIQFKAPRHARFSCTIVHHYLMELLNRLGISKEFKYCSKILRPHHAHTALQTFKCTRRAFEQLAWRCFVGNLLPQLGTIMTRLHWYLLQKLIWILLLASLMSSATGFTQSVSICYDTHLYNI